MTPERRDIPDKQPQEQDRRDEPPKLTRSGTDPQRVYRDDGAGCVERVHPAELAWEERYG